MDSLDRCQTPLVLRWQPYAVILALLFSCFQSVAQATGSYAEDSIELKLANGARLQARLRFPHSENAKKLQAVMLFGGLQRGAESLDLVESSVPMVLASFDYPFEVPQRADRKSLLGFAPEARRAIAQTLEGIGLLHRALAAHPRVDAQRITIVGVSLGAPFAVLAAEKHQLAGLGVIHGFARVRQVIAHQFIMRWEPDRGAWVRPLAHLLSTILCWYANVPDVEAAAGRMGADQNVWMIAAQDDLRIPAAAVLALRSAFLRSEAEFKFESETGGHLAGEDDPRIPDLLRNATRWMKLADLLS